MVECSERLPFCFRKRKSKKELERSKCEKTREDLNQSKWWASSWIIYFSYNTEIFQFKPDWGHDGFSSCLQRFHFWWLLLMGPYQAVSFKLRVKLVLISCLVRCLYTCLTTQVIKAYLRLLSLMGIPPFSPLHLSRYGILPIYIRTLVRSSTFQFRYKFLTRSQIFELSLHANTKINKIHGILHTRNIF